MDAAWRPLLPGLLRDWRLGLRALGDHGSQLSRGRARPHERRGCGRLLHESHAQRHGRRARADLPSHACRPLRWRRRRAPLHAFHHVRGGRGHLCGHHAHLPSRLLPELIWRLHHRWHTALCFQDPGVRGALWHLRIPQVLLEHWQLGTALCQQTWLGEGLRPLVSGRE